MTNVVRETTPLPEEVKDSLGRILESEEFTASAQLSRFLRYVVENRLSPGGQPLKESSVGLAVFRRAAGYDPKTDPIVRVEARRLRSRLDAYYAGAGAGDAVRISLPKGGYTPEFEYAIPVAALPETTAPLVSLPANARKETRPWRVAAAVFLLAALPAGIGFATWRVGAPDRLVGTFWRSILDSGKPVLVVPADSGLVMLQDLLHQQVPLHDYITGDYRGRAGKGDLESETIVALGQRRYTSIADLDFALRVSRRPEAARWGIQTRYARDLRMEDLRGSNVILLGARHSNPWVELFEPGAAFRIEHDEKSSAFRIMRASPGPGEADLTVTPSALRQEIFGIVTYHRNRKGPGVALVVAGTSVVGTEAAASLVLDDARLLPLLKKAESHGVIRGFDVLLRDRNLGSGGQRAEVADFRVER